MSQHAWRQEETYVKNPNSKDGFIYEENLCALFLKRAIDNNYYDFGLAEEVTKAEKFDDIVFWYKTSQDDERSYRFLQAKKAKGISYEQLKNPTNREFGLQK